MLTFDFGDFERAAVTFEGAAKQIPFALAGALNDAAKVTRDELVNVTWPQHVKARNRTFLGAALRREFARKNDLRVAIAETGPAAGRGSISLHAHGGTRQAKRSNIAIPSVELKAKRTGKGVPAGLRPAALPNSFKRGDVIYQRVGKYQKAGSRAAKRAGVDKGKGHDDRHLKLVYVLKPSAPIAADVPFEADFARIMTDQVWRAFTPRLQAALAARRK